jgi:hypothetical protein
MGFEFANIARQTEFLEWLSGEADIPFQTVPNDSVQQLTSGVESPGSWGKQPKPEA